MKRFALSGAGLTAAALAGVATTASADVTIDLVADTGSAAGCFSGGSFADVTSMTSNAGTLTAINIDAVMTTSGASYTWANDLAVIVIGASSNVIVQFGGYSDFGASQQTASYSGSSSSPDTPAVGSMVLDSPIDLATVAVLIGNGYAGGGNTCWSGSVTLTADGGGPVGPVCGDGYCDEGEDDLSCPDDCASSGDPCDEPLSECAADINSDGVINTSDLLDMISNYGSSGDGSSRPVGDIAPAPNGDCLVNTVDLLALISVFGSSVDCPSGPVCGDGVCEEGEECADDCAPVCGDGVCEEGEDCYDDCGCAADEVEDCVDPGECFSATWVGDGYCDGLDQQYDANLCCYEQDGGDCSNVECGNVTCGDGVCEGDETAETCPDDCYVAPDAGACCLSDGTCVDLDAVSCPDTGGTFQGAGTECTGFNPVTCVDLTAGDTFDNAIAIGVGETAFETTTASDSEQGTDGADCADTYYTAGGPDRWFAFTATESGNMDVSTCGLTDFDTNIAVYEGLDNSLACNGDAAGCAEYTSIVAGVPVTAGRTYQIEVSGWNGATGSGNLSVSVIPTDLTGACCLADGSCSELTQGDCAAAEGSWSEGACADSNCPQPLVCDGDAGEFGDVSTGATNDAGPGYTRATLAAVSSVTGVSVLGIEYNYDPASGFTGGCDEDMSFTVTIYEDAAGVPGEVLYSGVFAESSVDTGNVFGGGAAVNEYSFDLGTEVYTSGTCWISVQGGADVDPGSELDTGGCWFLQVDVAGGTNYGAINDGTGWAADGYQLAMCVTGSTSADVCGDGFCGDSESFETCPDDCVDPNACAPGTVEDCDGSGECHTEGWIGDGYCDGFEQQYGADLCCFELDGGDCTEADCQAPAEPVCGDGFCEGDETVESCPDDCSGEPVGCGADELEDCLTPGLCHQASWLGDGYCDGDLLQYGANLCCYELDGGDCADIECNGDPSDG